MRFAHVILCLGMLLVAAPASAGLTFSFTPVAVEGDLVAGIGSITSVDNLAVNDAGSYLVEVDTNNADTEMDGVMLRDGAVYVREGAALGAPPGSSVDSFDSVNLNNAGNNGWNFFLNGTSGTTDDSGIYFGTTLVIQESNISTAPTFTPGTPYIGFFDSKINDNDQVLVVASIDDPAIATTVDRALVRLDLTGSGGLVSETVLAKEGDVLAGQTEAVADFGTAPHQSAFNDAGATLYFVDLTGVTATDGAIYLDATLLGQEGSPSPVAGRNYELLSSRGLDLNDAGDHVFKANLDGATTDDEVIIKNGAVFRREGDTLPATGGFVFTSFGLTSGPVQMDNAGNVLWFGDWDDPNLEKDTALFLNDMPVIGEGSSIGSAILDEISNGEDAFQISDDGRWILFEGTFVGGLSAAILVEVLDDTVPVRIADLVALESGDRVRLLWQVADPENELAAIEVERAADEFGPYAPVAGGTLVPTANMEFEDAGVDAGQTYWYRLVLIGTDGSRSFAGPVTATSGVVQTALHAVFESALDGMVRLRYSSASSSGPVRLAIHDVRGRTLWSITDAPSPGRRREVIWDRRETNGGRVPRGVYFVHLQAGNAVASRKLLLARP